MGDLIRTVFVLGVLSAMCGGQFTLLKGAVAAMDLPVYFDPDVNEYWQGMSYDKRAGFWSPHPSDYNPMRRPNPVLRPSSKRDFDVMPYHPSAKFASARQRQGGDSEDYMDAILDGSEARLKKHIWPANLLYRLGGSPPPPPRGQKYVPSEPKNQ